MSVESCIDLSSDHTPVILNINSKVALVDLPNRIYNRKTNWEHFQYLLERETNLKIPLKSPEEIDLAVESFYILIHKTLQDSTPATKARPKTQHSYPKFIKDKVHERRNLRKIWHNTRYPSDKNKFNRASKELSILINNFQNSNLQNYLSKLSSTKNTNYSLWRATAKMKRPKCHIPPIKQRNNVWARSDKEKAIAFAEHLKRVFQPFPSTRNEQDSKVRNYLASALQMCLPIKCVTPRELVKEIKTLQEGKSPGYDLIDATILKHIPKKSIVFLTTVFNACLRLSYFPSQFKIAQVVMIPKPGKSANEVESYRPISLLPFLSKLLEKIILSRMKPHLPECIPNHQFGFREGHGTIEQVHRLTDVISRTLENKKYCSAVFLDIGQAFDKVWHEGLLYKLKKTLPHSFFNILKSYLSKRCFEVKFNGECSDLHEITSGVPQGSILGPILYLIFTADLPENDNTITATYADDTALLSVHADPVTATSNLQKHLTKVEEWLNLWRIRANQSKSAHVTFTLRKDTCPPVTLNGETIPQVDTAKYLGMHLDRRLTWRKHIWTKRKQLDTKVRNFTWLIGKHSQLSKHSKITIYKAILKPIWTYGIELWGTASNSNIEILERFQSKTLRNMLNIPWYITNKYIHQDLQMKTVKQEIMCNSMRYQKRLSCHGNDLASQLQGTGSLLFSRLKRKSVFHK